MEFTLALEFTFSSQHGVNIINEIIKNKRRQIVNKLLIICRLCWYMGVIPLFF